MEEILNDFKKEAIDELKLEIFDYLVSSDKKNRGMATELIAERIMKTFDIITIMNDHESEIFIYHKGIYVPNGKSIIKMAVRWITGKAYSPQLANQVLSKIEADTFEDESVLELKNPFEIPVKNGLLDLKKRKLNPFTPKKIYFNKIPVEYAEEVDCPKIKKFFSDILREGDIKIIQELFGYCLVKENLFERAFMFLGEGRNGKTKSVDIIKRFLGPENTCSIPIHDLQSGDFRISELFGKLANLGADLDSKSLFNTGIFKSLTGRDQISAKRKFMRDIHFVNYSKQIFACNELPEIYDKSLGFWDRWILIDFPNRFVSEQEYNSSDDKTNLKIINPYILEEIISDNEMTGLLNWALEGLNRLVKNKNFSYSQTTKEVKDQWTRKSNSFSGFFMDCVVEDWENRLPKQDLKKAYTQYCKRHKLKIVGDQKIKNLLDSEGVYDGKSGSDHFWSGVKLKKEFGQEGQEVQGFDTNREKNKIFYRHQNVSQPAQLAQFENQENLQIMEESIE